MLGVDGIQAHGLLRNCDWSNIENNNLINIVETYFKLARSLPDQEYIKLIRNAVYSQDKAVELKQTMDVLGFNWFNLKEQIKTLKLAQAPQVASRMLQKNKFVNLKEDFAARPQKRDEATDNHEIDILLKLLPYFDVPLNPKKAVEMPQ